MRRVVGAGDEATLAIGSKCGKVKLKSVELVPHHRGLPVNPLGVAGHFDQTINLGLDTAELLLQKPGRRSGLLNLVQLKDR